MKMNPLTQAVIDGVQEMNAETKMKFYYLCPSCGRSESHDGHSSSWDSCPGCGSKNVTVSAGISEPDWWTGEACEGETSTAPLKCKSIFGHRYRPRHSSSPAPQAVYDQISASGLPVKEAERLILAMRTITYIADVCTRCGDIVRPGMEQGGSCRSEAKT